MEAIDEESSSRIVLVWFYKRNLQMINVNVGHESKGRLWESADVRAAFPEGCWMACDFHKDLKVSEVPASQLPRLMEPPLLDPADGVHWRQSLAD